MGIFDLLFGKKVQKTNSNYGVANASSAPEVHYVHTNQNGERVIDND